MSVVTTYEEMRDVLRDNLNECLKLSKEMLDEDIWGYKDIIDDYAINNYIAIKKVRDSI